MTSSSLKHVETLLNKAQTGRYAPPISLSTKEFVKKMNEAVERILEGLDLGGAALSPAEISAAVNFYNKNFPVHKKIKTPPIYEFLYEQSLVRGDTGYVLSLGINKLPADLIPAGRFTVSGLDNLLRRLDYQEDESVDFNTLLAIEGIRLGENMLRSSLNKLEAIKQKTGKEGDSLFLRVAYYFPPYKENELTRITNYVVGDDGEHHPSVGFPFAMPLVEYKLSLDKGASDSAISLPAGMVNALNRWYTSKYGKPYGLGGEFYIIKRRDYPYNQMIFGDILNKQRSREATGRILPLAPPKRLSIIK